MCSGDVRLPKPDARLPAGSSRPASGDLSLCCAGSRAGCPDRRGENFISIIGRNNNFATPTWQELKIAYHGRETLTPSNDNSL